MSPEQIKLAIAAAVVAGAFAAGGGIGWTVNGWRLAGEIRQLQGVVSTQVQSMATLEGANKNCVAGVAGVRAEVKELVDDAKQRSAEAAAAMAAAAKEASGHLAAAKSALARPPVVRGKECPQAASEASTYARKRKAAP